MKRIAVSLGILLLLVTGCATTVEKSGKDVEGEPAKVIKAGITTRDEIIKAFGEPSSSSTKDGSEELVYESRKVETPTYMGGLVINEAGKAVTLKRLEVVIKDGTVQSYRYEVKGE
ncbi:MAG: hypothetical protein Q7T53_01450 [Deltaproteobacteria bacterium]|nr:hypothetical protein [Deltaproteobacteria bacterium]